MICQDSSVHFPFNVEDVLIFSLRNNLQKVVKVCLDAVRDGLLSLSHSCALHLVVNALSSALKCCREEHDVLYKDKQLVFSCSHILRYLRFLQSYCCAADGFELYASATMKLHKFILLHFLQEGFDANGVKDYVRMHVLPDFTNQSLVLQKDVSLLKDFRRKALKLQSFVSALSDDENKKSSLVQEEMENFRNDDFWNNLNCDLKLYLEKIQSFLPASKLPECLDLSCLQELVPNLTQVNLSDDNCEKLVLTLLERMLNQLRSADNNSTGVSSSNALTQDVSMDKCDTNSIHENLVGLSTDCKNEGSKKNNRSSSNPLSSTLHLSSSKLNGAKSPIVVLRDVRYEKLDYVTADWTDVPLNDVNSFSSKPFDVSTDKKVGDDPQLSKESIAKKIQAETTPEANVRAPHSLPFRKRRAKGPSKKFKQLDNFDFNGKLSLIAKSHCQIASDKENDAITSQPSLCNDQSNLKNVHPNTSPGDPDLPRHSTFRRKLFSAFEQPFESRENYDDFILNDDEDDDIIDESDISDDDSVILSLETGHLPDFSKFLYDESNCFNNPVVTLFRI